MNRVNRDFVVTMFRAIDNRDWDALATHFHPEMVYERPGFPVLEGRDAVMRFYREEARRLGIRPSPFSFLLRRSQLVASLVPWLISYLYPSQRRWFERLHNQAWGAQCLIPLPSSPTS